jgi:hypothetical protein
MIHKSTIGGIFTLICGFFAILFFIGFGYDLFEKKRPEILNSKEFNQDNTLEADQLKFLILPHLPGGGKIKELSRKVMPFMYHVQTEAGKPAIYNIEPLVPCQITKSYKTNFMNITTMLNGDYEDAYCLPDNFKLPMKGQFGNSKFYLHQFRLLRCVNSTTKIDCNTSEEIDKALESFFVQFIFLDYYLDMSNY